MKFLLTLFITAFFSQACKNEIPIPATKSPPTLSEAKPERWVKQLEIRKGETLSSVLQKAKVDPQTAFEMIDHAGQSVDLRALQPGMSITISGVKNRQKSPDSLKIELTKTQIFELYRDSIEAGWQTREILKNPTEVVKQFRGVVDSSLWESARDNSMDPSLIMELTEIFSWAIDFNREVRKGDRWRLVVKELQIAGEAIGRLPIEIAEYQSNTETLTAIFYKGRDKEFGSYFYPDGNSLRQMFLKSPIKFGRVTSKFNKKRFHPILKRKVPHNGVDYGAPPGTPVRTVGDGWVSFAGRKGASGIMVSIRHNSVYQTSYLHLKGIRKGIRRGQKVAQGEVIGYVGSTGRATGPHLHFAFYESGRFVDPMGRKFPSADPVPKAEMSNFRSIASAQLDRLPPWSSVTWYLPSTDKAPAMAW